MTPREVEDTKRTNHDIRTFNTLGDGAISWRVVLWTESRLRHLQGKRLGVEAPPEHSRFFWYMDARGWNDASI